MRNSRFTSERAISAWRMPETIARNAAPSRSIVSTGSGSATSSMPAPLRKAASRSPSAGRDRRRRWPGRAGGRTLRRGAPARGPAAGRRAASRSARLRDRWRREIVEIPVVRHLGRRQVDRIRNCRTMVGGCWLPRRIASSSGNNGSKSGASAGEYGIQRRARIGIPGLSTIARTGGEQIVVEWIAERVSAAVSNRRGSSPGRLGLLDQADLDLVDAQDQPVAVHQRMRRLGIRAAPRRG